MLADDRRAIEDLLRGRRVGRGRPGLADDGECWVFIGARDGCGYGVIRRADFNGSRVHRYIYEKFVGPIPDGAQVLHRCDNPPCVRPSHLWIGTQQDNIRDMIVKGRLVPPPVVRREFCASGRHRMEGDNVYLPPNQPTKRRCRACMHEKSREWALKNADRKREYMRDWHAGRVLQTARQR